MALKAHDVTWYLGVSELGGVMAVKQLDSKRCHFRVDVDPLQLYQKILKGIADDRNPPELQSSKETKSPEDGPKPPEDGPKSSEDSPKQPVKGMGFIFDNEGYVKTGALVKKSRERGVWALVPKFLKRPWALRRVKLHRDKLIRYFDGNSMKGEIDIRGCQAREISPRDADGKTNAFGIYNADQTRLLLLLAENGNERGEWIAAINAVVRL